MKLIYLGKITSTHGIKGELKIHSNFEYKIQAFRVGNHLTINNVDYTIKSYRRHKDFDMVTLNDYKDINEVQFLLKQKVYIKEEELNLENDEVLDEDLLNYKVIINNDIGFIKEVFFASLTNKVLRINIDNKEILEDMLTVTLNEAVKNMYAEKEEALDKASGGIGMAGLF